MRMWGGFVAIVGLVLGEYVTNFVWELPMAGMEGLIRLVRIRSVHYLCMTSSWFRTLNVIGSSNIEAQMRRQRRCGEDDIRGPSLRGSTISFVPPSSKNFVQQYYI